MHPCGFQLNKQNKNSLIMKKTLIAVLALAAVAACNKAEVIDQKAPAAISFENPFVENATRSVADPSTETADLEAFTVYGFMDTPSGIVFNEEPVTLDGTEWKTATTQYWTLGHDYYFAALAGEDWALNTATASTNGAGTVSFTNKNGTNDLLYAAATATTKGENFVITENNPGPVAFTFNHLLSKVKFAFTNGFANPNTSIVVKNVTLAVPATGSVNLGEASWWEGDKWTVPAESALTLQFGDIVVPTTQSNGNVVVEDATGDKVYPSTNNAESYNERLTIPTAFRTYTITFTAELYQGETLAGTYNHEAVVEGIRFQMGHAYKFTAELNGTNINPAEQLIPIKFTVNEVKGWETEEVYDGGELDTVVNN